MVTDKLVHIVPVAPYRAPRATPTARSRPTSSRTCRKTRQPARGQRRVSLRGSASDIPHEIVQAPGPDPIPPLAKSGVPARTARPPTLAGDPGPGHLDDPVGKDEHDSALAGAAHD